MLSAIVAALENEITIHDDVDCSSWKPNAVQSPNKRAYTPPRFSRVFFQGHTTHPMNLGQLRRIRARHNNNPSSTRTQVTAGASIEKKQQNLVP